MAEIRVDSFIQRNGLICVTVLKTNIAKETKLIALIFSPTAFPVHRNNMLIIFLYTWLMHCVGLLWLSPCWRQLCFLLSIILASSEEKFTPIHCFIQLRSILQDGKGWYLRNEIATRGFPLSLICNQASWQRIFRHREWIFNLTGAAVWSAGPS